MKNSIQNLNHIINFICSNDEPISYTDLTNYCISCGIYKEFLINYDILEHIIDEHNNKPKENITYLSDTYF